MIACLLLLSGLALVQCQVVKVCGERFASECFNSAVIKSYDNFGSFGPLRFGIDFVIEERFLPTKERGLERAALQRALGKLNTMLAPIGVSFGDLKFHTMDASVAAEKDIEGRFAAAVLNSKHATLLKSGRVPVFWSWMGVRTTVGGRVQALPYAQEIKQIPIIWMNADYYATGLGFVDDDTFAHEMLHAMGLQHTFDYFPCGCPDTDMIDDTSIGIKGGGECADQKKIMKNACDKDVMLDFTNIMSYGSCKSGPRITKGQRRMVRCVVERELVAKRWWKPLAAPPAVSAAKSDVVAAGNMEASRAVAAQSSSARQVLDSCNGVRGFCIDSSMSCEGGIVKDRCRGSKVCCRDKSAPEVPPLPGVGSSCIGMSGTCLDIDVSTCSTGFVPRMCSGPSQVQCCASSSGASTTAPSNGLVDTSQDVPFSDSISMPIGFTVHVGQTLALNLPYELKNVRAYILQTDVAHIPTTEELVGRQIELSAVNGQNVAVVLNGLVAGGFVDRGEHSMVFMGDDAESVPKTFVSSVFTIDVNSCAVDEAQFGVPYGLIRTFDACESRGNAVAKTLNAGLVCCVPKAIETCLKRRVVDNDNAANLSPTTTTSSIEETTTTVFDDAAMTTATTVVETTTIDENGLRRRRNSPPDELCLSYFGSTSFWGAPMTVATISGTPAALRLASAAGVESLPPVALTPKTGSPTKFTPIVANPGVFILTDEDMNAATASFSVVALPCATRSGSAGYCVPRSVISTADGQQTDAGLLCAQGETEQCAGLSVNGVNFACCAGVASLAQKQASYRAGKTLLEDDAARSGTSVVVALVAAAFVIVY